MKIAFSTISCPDYTLPQMAEAVRAYGYDGIELYALEGQKLLPDMLMARLDEVRSAFFFPVITSIASVAVIWGYLYNTDNGIINYYLTQMGIPKIPWLASSKWALWSIIFMIVWKSLGFDFILFLAGVQNISRQLYEAAVIDGATSLQQFRFITLPLLTPTIFFVVVIGLIGSFQVFDAPYIMTDGGPGDATRMIAMHIYENGFRFLRMGYASAIAMLLFAIILLITVFQMLLSKRWVFYQ